MPRVGCCNVKKSSAESTLLNSTLLFIVIYAFVLTPTFCGSFYRNRKVKMAESRKPNKLYATHPSNYGKGSRACRVTGRLGGMGLVRKYGINMKRQVFRERALDMGFVKYS